MFSHFLEFDGEGGGRQTHEVGCQQQQPKSNCMNFASHVKEKPAFSRKAIFLVSWLKAVEGESVHLTLILKYIRFKGLNLSEKRQNCLYTLIMQLFFLLYVDKLSTFQVTFAYLYQAVLNPFWTKCLSGCINVIVISFDLTKEYKFAWRKSISSTSENHFEAICSCM